MPLLQEFITAAMDRKRALTSETLTRVFSELDDDDDGELGPRVFCSALQVLTLILLSLSGTLDATTGLSIGAWGRVRCSKRLWHWRMSRFKISRSPTI